MDPVNNYGTNLQASLSEADVEKIVDRVCDRLEKKLYLNLGKGAVAVLWKIILTLGIAIAGYGAGVHLFK